MELQPTAQIIITAHYDTNGAVDNCTFEWQGGEILWVSRELIEESDERYIRQDGQFLTVGPYRLRFICERPVGDILVYHLDSPRAVFMVRWYRLLISLERVHYGLLRQLARWGIIRCEEGDLFTWQRFVLVEWANDLVWRSPDWVREFIYKVTGWSLVKRYSDGNPAGYYWEKFPKELLGYPIKYER